MAITTAMCNSFKQELLGGIHDLDTDTIKLALIKATPSGSYGATTTTFDDLTGNSDEAVGTGYTSGGKTLSGVISLSNNTAFVDFEDVMWEDATITADGCMIYNASKNNSVIAVFDFGGTRTSTVGSFSIEFPAANETTAVVRVT